MCKILIIVYDGNLQDGEAPEFVKEPYNTQMLNRGLVSGSYDANRVTKSIDQAFTQSPYLNTK